MRMVSVFQSTPLHEGRPIPRESLDWIKRVSIHAPARGATRRLPAVPRGLHRFNPRPCTRGDGSPRGAFVESSAFQSTPLHEGRQFCRASFRRRSRFQSTPLHEGRPTSTPPTSFRMRFQSTPLHEGRQVSFVSMPLPSPVSIHAPARGATAEAAQLARLKMFQSTPLHEGRQVPISPGEPVSPFQSTPLHEGRPVTPEEMARYMEFQSTPLHEGRLYTRQRCPACGKFQSTPLHEGRRNEAGDQGYDHHVSIHAPARGATSIVLVKAS